MASRKAEQVKKLHVLRINQNNSAAGAKSYYSTADYYTQAQELTGRWCGKGAAMLGLHGQITGEVGKQQWNRLCDNLHPLTGAKLMPRTREERRIGYDINFHAPKSLSVLYSLTHDAQVLEAFREAVSATMAQMESEMQTRVRAGGRDEDRTTGNLVYGEFVHTTARPVDGIPDPHLHAHCFTFNTTFDKDEQRWKAGQFGGLKHNAPYFEAVFHAELAHRMQQLGLAVQRTRQGWELGDLPASIVKKFSRRTAQIEQEAAEKGISSAKQKDKLGAKTRERKAKHLTHDELVQAWSARLSPEESMAVSRVARDLGVTRADGDAPSDPSKHASKFKTTPLSHGRHTAEPAIPPSPDFTREVVELAKEHCFERSAVVPEREVLARAMRLGVGHVTPHAVIDAAVRSDLIAREIGGRRMVTTREVLAEGQAILDCARAGRGACSALGSRDEKPVRDFLSDEQLSALRHVLSSTDRVVLLRGAAGTGKTTLMQETVGAIERNGKRVFTFAPSAGASHGVLNEAGFTDANTVAMLLEDRAKHEAMRGQVIWIDEAGLLGSKATRRVLALASELHARVILSGDKRQHGSVERGGVLALLEREAGLVPAELRQIRRQGGAYKQAVMALSEGKVAEGFARLDELGWVREIPDRSQREHQLAKAYLESVRAKGSTLVVCPTHHEALAVTQEIRAMLRQQGKLQSPGTTYQQLRPVSLTLAERRDPLSYRSGDVLVFHKHAPGIRKGSKYVIGREGPAPLAYADRYSVYRPDVISIAAGDRIRITKNRAPRREVCGPSNMRLNNGDLLTVQAIDAKGDLELSNGARLSKDFGHIDYGYVVTSHASQGKSVDRVIVAQSSVSFRASSREQFYVSVSRGKSQALIVTDDKQALQEAVQQADQRMTATQLITMRLPHRNRSDRAARRSVPATPNRSRPGENRVRILPSSASGAEEARSVLRREGNIHER
jgi:conjugative relaxase-like TrwC/TraI family protein